MPIFFMDTTKKFFVGVGVLFGGFLIATSSSVQAVGFPGGEGAPNGPPTVADCVERSGKTEAECQTMIEGFKNGERPKMTVESCVERTGKTEAECQTMMDGQKNGERPVMGGQKDNRGGMRGGNGESAGMMGGARSVSTAEALSVRAERQKADRAQIFANITTRTEKFIAYLDSKSVDTSSVKTMFETLQAKMAGALSAFDTYIASLKVWEGEKNNDNAQVIAANKAALKTSLTEVKTYYRETLIPALRSLVESVNE